MTNVRITHKITKEVLAEGPIGLGVTPFEGNFYIQNRYLKTNGFKINYIPGLCIYKFLYVWMDYRYEGKRESPGLGWKYWLPNPLLPFIWFRVALPDGHPDLEVERFEV